MTDKITREKNYANYAQVSQKATDCSVVEIADKTAAKITVQVVGVAIATTVPQIAAKSPLVYAISNCNEVSNQTSAAKWQQKWQQKSLG